MNGQISNHFNAFVKAGGKVLVCPHCAEVAGITVHSSRATADSGSVLIFAPQLRDAIGKI